MVPGPGTYPLTSRIGADAVKSTIGSRTSANSIWQNNKVPGPGSYVPRNVTFTSPKFTMKGKYSAGANLIVNSDGSHEKVPSHAIDGTVPGPGTYSASTG
jgi:hypothetical protein